MPRFYIEIPHEAETIACLRAVRVLQDTGSHLLTHADYGCYDGDHTARITVEVESKNDALMMVPPVYRPKARIIQLNSFSREEIDELMKKHIG